MNFNDLKNMDIKDLFSRKGGKDLDSSDETLNNSSEKGDSKADGSNVKKTKLERQVGIPLGRNILVDLIPASYRDVVELRATKRKWIVGVIGIITACVVVSGAVYVNSAIVSNSLTKELSVHEVLDNKISAYAEVNQALDSQAEAKKLLAKGASTEVDWEKLIGNIQSSLPSGTTIASISSIVGEDPKSDVAVGIKMSLSSTSTIGHSDSLKAMKKMGGVKDVEIGGLQLSGENNYTYNIAFTYDKSILTERFTTTLEGLLDVSK